jgi:dTDP-glucose 4,6-dehydratase
VAARILEALGKPPGLKRFVTDRPGHDYRYSVDAAKAEALGWKPKWSWPQGLEQTVRWYCRNESWWRRVKERLEFRQHERQWYSDR